MAAILPDSPGIASEDWKRAQAIFLAALEQPPERRDEFARGLCAGNEIQWAIVSRLLAGHAAPNPLLGTVTPAPAGDFTPENDLVLPCVLGAYRLLEKVGAGGMGAVYRAERSDGQFEKQVAVKLMAGSALTSKAVKRFVTERQILANLDHAHIARLLDGGVAGDGRPYIVMEYVDGVPIDRFCRDRNLTVEETVALFEKVCTAVEYAHQHGVIHRDIKPGNLLVTPDGTPKLLDFGISKLLDAEAEQAATVTVDGHRALTPDYASPEQLMGKPATAASDVYSLGVLLYELLTGERPKDGATTSVHSKPERRISRDLDAIVIKALAPDPAARYASGREFREDLEQYRHAMPVAARPRAVLPRIAKFVRRYRWQAMTAAMLVATIVCVVVLVRYNQRKSVERKRQTIAAVLALFQDTYRRVAGTPQSADTRRMLFQPMQTQLDALERESGDDAEVLYQIALGYCRLGQVEAGYFGSVGDIRSGLDTFQRARSAATRAAAKSGGVREKQLLVYILQSIAFNALWDDQIQTAASAVSDGLQILDRNELQLRRAGLEEFTKEYRTFFIMHEAHILQAQNRLEDSLSLWLKADSDVARNFDINNLSYPYMKAYQVAEIKLRLAEHYCWSGDPRVGARYAQMAAVVAGRVSALTHEMAHERQARVTEAICEIKANEPRKALQVAKEVKDAYENDLKSERHNNYLLAALSTCDRVAGDALARIGDLSKAAKAYSEGLSLLRSSPDFASSPAALLRVGQISASLGDLESKRSRLSPRGSKQSAAHMKSACAYYDKAEAIFQERRNGVIYIENRVAMAEVEERLPDCEAAGYRMQVK
jgi:tetratricopeptide (TPR) repeat protein